ncbi:APC family permease [Marinivivus vitaminiproducens]|uniref:APC family permease n=1 Tax=Marinivivus vitaminiproducens TaxID=3035935 RepID=UPI0027A87DF1|nr:APC family permease [Geminicoccaceae bacterium SCSIO 64248]
MANTSNGTSSGPEETPPDERADAPHGLRRRLRRLLFGRPLDPFQVENRHKLLLAAVVAWIGLGADGLSSANYGPEEAFIGLGQHTQLAPFLVIAIAATVLIIALAYMQVIELFPSGGGGYKVASRLLHPYAGLVSGTALVVDYSLTIAISVSAGIDALFSLMPLGFEAFQVPTGLVLIALLAMMNLRGAKETIVVLAPIFFGFLITHGVLVVFGIVAHADRMPGLLPGAVQDAAVLSAEIGWGGVIATLVQAYAVGAGTYTGIEAVSNNVNVLAEPRVRTGQRTMWLMAVSLAFTAGGILLLYLLWDVRHEPGRTLNATTFAILMADWTLGGVALGPPFLWIAMLFAAALLLVAANTGFLGGPAVMANMALDRWLPYSFAHLSTRLVTERGILLMAAAAAGLLIVTGGNTALIVVLYSINVFVTFVLSLAGLCAYGMRHRAERPKRRLAIAFLGFVVALGILIGLIFSKFAEGGWLTLVITGGLIALCYAIKRHYVRTRALLKAIEGELCPKGRKARPTGEPPVVDRDAPTAVILLGDSLGVGMHTLLAVRRMFGKQFQTFVFIAVGEVDAASYGGVVALRNLEQEVGARLGYFQAFCRDRGIASETYAGFGTDLVQELTTLADRVHADFPNSVFFAARLVFSRDRWFSRILHNQAPMAMQRRLHLQGLPMMILPVRVEDREAVLRSAGVASG